MKLNMTIDDAIGDNFKNVPKFTDITKLSKEKLLKRYIKLRFYATLAFAFVGMMAFFYVFVPLVDFLMEGKF